MMYPRDDLWISIGNRVLTGKGKRSYSSDIHVPSHKMKEAKSKFLSGEFQVVEHFNGQNSSFFALSTPHRSTALSLSSTQVPTFEQKLTSSSKRPCPFINVGPGNQVNRFLKQNDSAF
jgi:hypothetical protein